jgi:hypothetical protein
MQSDATSVGACLRSLPPDRIAASARSSTHYESIRVRQFEANVVEESLARAFRNQST